MNRLAGVGRRCFLLIGPLVAAAGPAAAAAPETGFREEVRVAAPTRLDWKFVASAFGPEAAKLPAGYDSRRQRYQLFVPHGYDAARAWPLVVFISPGDDPLGWPSWREPCERAGLLFCAAYGGGNSCPPGQRTRLVLDVLDDVRRHYRIDPDQTYLTGFSGGGRMACTIAFHLPEYFGGVAPVCGTNPLPSQDYLRHRVRDRLSVAFITGADDFNRKENEDYMAPLCHDLGVRTKLGVVPRMGHALPPADVLAGVASWLAEDLPRRRADARAHPGLAAVPDDVPTPDRQAARQVEAAEAELKKAGHAWRAVALLRGVVQRWGDTDAADRARRLLKDIQADAGLARALAREGGEDERQTLTAQAKALERFGDLRRARKAWEMLARAEPDTLEGDRAAAAARRLAAALAATPYLGVAFADDTLVAEVVRGGPADRAGLEAGDRLAKLGGQEVSSLRQVREVLAKHRPGDKLEAVVERGGKARTLTVELGSPPADE
jgi:dienelactone hydrolase